MKNVNTLFAPKNTGAVLKHLHSIGYKTVVDSRKSSHTDWIYVTEQNVSKPASIDRALSNTARDRDLGESSC